jgi:hypothetical protein
MLPWVYKICFFNSQLTIPLNIQSKVFSIALPFAYEHKQKIASKPLSSSLNQQEIFKCQYSDTALWHSPLCVCVWFCLVVHAASSPVVCVCVCVRSSAHTASYPEVCVCLCVYSSATFSPVVCELRHRLCVLRPAGKACTLACCLIRAGVSNIWPVQSGLWEFLGRGDDYFGLKNSRNYK